MAGQVVQNIMLATNELCSNLANITQACAIHPDKFPIEGYPGKQFFIDPDGMDAWQLVFVFFVYGYVLFISADMIGDGAELLLLVPGYADMVGSMVLPILGAIPDGMMVLFSGIGPLEEAQENVNVGVGALAGSTIMLLTLPWILSVYAAQVDMDADGKCVGYKQKAGNRKTGKSAGTGCQFQDGVSKNAILMFLTSLSYFVIQIPAFVFDNQKTKSYYNITNGGDEAFIDEVKWEADKTKVYAGAGIGVTLFFFFLYLYLQFLAATDKKPPFGFLKALLPPPRDSVNVELVAIHGLVPLIDKYRQNYQTTGGMRGQEVNLEYGESFLGQKPLPKDLAEPLKKKFQEYCKKTPDSKGLHGDDMRHLLKEVGLSYTPEAFAPKFRQADKDDSKYLDQGEFLNFFQETITGADPLPYQKKQEDSKDDAGEGGDDDDEEDEMPDEFRDLSPDEQQKQIFRAACKSMLTGTFLVLIFSDPMVDVLARIGSMTGVPAFYVSFVLAPLASNASELVSSYKLAARKTSTSITQSLQTLEGAACMNNTFCLGIFYVLIYVQGLAWKFTAETLSIFFVQVLVFAIVRSGTTQTIAKGAVIFSCYPLSLLLVNLLEGMGYD